MLRTGTARPTRVGPKAAVSLLDWLACPDPGRLFLQEDSQG